MNKPDCRTMPGVLSPALMAGLRETPVREVKYLVPEGMADGVREWMRRHLRPDPYAGGPCGDEYSTRTLYLDTPGMGILLRRPGAGRSKYRVRRYDNAGFAFLERKLRAPCRLLKRRSLLAEAELSALADPCAPLGESCEWFRRRMERKALAPVCLVSYARTARQCAPPGGPVRLTLDRSLRVARAHGFTLDGAAWEPVLPGFAVLEMKYAGDLPSLLKNLLETFPITPARVSKYREACAVLLPGESLRHHAA